MRVFYTLGLMMIFMAIVSDSCSFGKAWLSNKVFRIVARSLAVGCVIQIIVAQFIYMSD
jgi:hypothetical protein